MKSLLLSTVLSLCCLVPAVADEWGNLTGQIVVTGEIPEPVLLFKKGAAPKDQSVCSPNDVYADDLLIDKDSKGLANVVVYLPKAPSKIHPDLKEPPKETLIFDQKDCVFMPHVMVVRCGQTVEVISSDNVQHNTHTNPIKNTGMNVLIGANVPAGKGHPVVYSAGETVPIKVNCDLHNWMIAWWMIVDHPYAAVTDKDGKFTIPGLPVGDHEFRIWRETTGYLEKKFPVTVASGDNALKTYEVSIDRLKPTPAK